MKDLNGKVAIITGGTRGIGKAILQRFAHAGATVYFTYVSSTQKAETLAKELSNNGSVIACQSDASKLSDAADLIKKVVSEQGRIDILINNAGITRDNLLMRMTEEQWDQVMEVNLKSVFTLTKQVLRPMMKNRNGCIINLTSVVGVFGNAGQSNYAASKAGIIGFTKSVAKEVGSRNIRCNAIAPGFIQTEMTDALDDKTKDAYMTNVPLNRFGTTDEIAAVCHFLSSDSASYITGQVISICGGLNI
jgi:3-oxoacyl-[acyl-carrier protein] reductase